MQGSTGTAIATPPPRLNDYDDTTAASTKDTSHDNSDAHDHTAHRARELDSSIPDTDRAPTHQQQLHAADTETEQEHRYNDISVSDTPDQGPWWAHTASGSNDKHEQQQQRHHHRVTSSELSDCFCANLMQPLQQLWSHVEVRRHQIQHDHDQFATRGYVACATSARLAHLDESDVPRN